MVALCILVASRTVMANTEIVNFDASPVRNVELPEVLDWFLVGPSNSQLMLRVQPAPVDTSITTLCEPVAGQTTIGKCGHEAWLRLDLDATPWSSYSKFTLRISWPAMVSLSEYHKLQRAPYVEPLQYPADFYIDLHSPASLASLLHGADQDNNERESSATPPTRRKFARIRMIHAGVFTPSSSNRTIEAVPFIVTVEPLYLGVLPASLVPTVLVLLGVVAVAGVIVYPRISSYLFGVAEQVKMETATAGKHRKQ
ncbi:hypothetical protein NUW54_g2009 [Trametes sanguinea]|uniref:Uncharacterized protein n=1 Tax=Trametes sanguinea TaxID=158606 RepID=A0ACC1Q4S0_9APHY|nr:hypothetical protein NUW54_g2009 [Trametes sanguinea]